jgi:ABC-type oligopeptide transport system substrate-binding subunit
VGPLGEGVALSVRRSAAKIGIALAPKGEDTSVYYTDIQGPAGGPRRHADGAWGEDFEDASTFMIPLLGSAAAFGGANDGDYANGRTDHRIAAIDRMPLGDARNRAWSGLSTSVMRARLRSPSTVSTGGRSCSHRG